MILADVHTHTVHGHGKNTVAEMFAAGQRAGLKIHGFSEHSPRPQGYDYPVEYRDKLTAEYPEYIRQVRALAAEQATGDILVLLGLELDWFEEETAFMAQVLAAESYAYVIGGIHFLGTWGFDATAEDWSRFTEEELGNIYTRYYQTMTKMAQSGMFNVVAHPDLIKLFTREAFHAWLTKPASQARVCQALEAVKQAGMAMEISSAGLRKPCKEVYPCPQIMGMARDLKLPISFASDGHCVNTIAANFDILEQYARSYGYTESLVFNRGDILPMPF